MELKDIKKFYFPEPILKILRSPILGISKDIDYWLVIHFLSGVILYYILGAGRNMLVILLLILYEIFEYYGRKQGIGSSESPLNITLDIIMGYLGYIIFN